MTPAFYVEIGETRKRTVVFIRERAVRLAVDYIVDISPHDKQCIRDFLEGRSDRLEIVKVSKVRHPDDVYYIYYASVRPCEVEQ